MPADLDDAMSLVIPEQRRADLFPGESEKTTFREKLGLSHPANRASAPHDANVHGPYCSRRCLMALKIRGCGQPG
ncbi:hypothetical protein SAMN05192568_104420 [Methylobacterium pseudosasicola]|uniref:Uncharacterized protein n=1 Tax=Methylobacterium pseudosasicola TaxID=582667 RepID=A0A1I4SPN6_9HYPH|nr:hypothetical protein SAMN05192568_104420 [Methylobacterium pseudosasicola]